MNTRPLICALTLAALFQGAGALRPVSAQEASVVIPPDAMTYRPPPAGGGVAETVVLYGDPTKPGVFVMRMRFPKGSKVMPGWRPDAWRTAVVISGTFYYGIGERWDESKLQAYPPGTFFSHPPKHPHFAWARDGEVVVQFTAMGPTRITRIPQD